MMENRKPFELRKVLIVYNFLQVIFSCWLFYEASITGWLTGYSFRCQPVDYSRSPMAMRVSVNIYIYHCQIEKKKFCHIVRSLRLKYFRLVVVNFNFLFVCMCLNHRMKNEWQKWRLTGLWSEILCRIIS